MFGCVLGYDVKLVDFRPSTPAINPLKNSCLHQSPWVTAVTPKGLGSPPVDRDRRNAHPGVRVYKVRVCGNCRRRNGESVVALHECEI
ncbi:hypothetical protein TNCV_1587611 [Trichonephila clavipes]|uniref:Uncharacterized protein n=1 Tax=Trichonephila clavipes TaxID=2585209 RepID=A0A8X6UZG9_TRICX|nr:hypothetical protein TNCV_1587611 [Trichonephila clavipes]